MDVPTETQPVAASNSFWNLSDVVSDDESQHVVRDGRMNLPLGQLQSKGDDTLNRQVRKGWRKPPGMPKRPMSSYNLYFQLERERLLNGEEEREFTLNDIDRIVMQQKQKDESSFKRKHRKSHGKISFSELARVIANKWKALDDSAKAPFFERAAYEKAEYKIAVDKWTRSKVDTSIDSQDEIRNIDHHDLLHTHDNMFIRNHSNDNIKANSDDDRLKFYEQRLDSMLFNNTGHRRLGNQTLNNVDIDVFPAVTTPTRQPTNSQDIPYAKSMEHILNLRRDMALHSQQQNPMLIPQPVKFPKQNRNVHMSNVAKGTTYPFKSYSESAMPYSPASTLENLINQDIRFSPRSNSNPELFPDNIIAESGVDFYPGKMMRRRTFAQGDMRLINTNNNSKSQKLSSLIGAHVHSEYCSCHNHEFNKMYEWTGLPLDALHDDGSREQQFLPSSKYSMPIRQTPLPYKRRSTFSGVAMNDFKQNPRLMGRYFTNGVNSRQGYPISQSPNQESLDNFPSREVIIKGGINGRDVLYKEAASADHMNYEATLPDHSEARDFPFDVYIPQRQMLSTDLATSYDDNEKVNRLSQNNLAWGNQKTSDYNDSNEEGYISYSSIQNGESNNDDTGPRINDAMNETYTNWEV